MKGGSVGSTHIPPVESTAHSPPFTAFQLKPPATEPRPQQAPKESEAGGPFSPSHPALLSWTVGLVVCSLVCNHRRCPPPPCVRHLLFLSGGGGVNVRLECHLSMTPFPGPGSSSHRHRHIGSHLVPSATIVSIRTTMAATSFIWGTLAALCTGVAAHTTREYGTHRSRRDSPTP